MSARPRGSGTWWLAPIGATAGLLVVVGGIGYLATPAVRVAIPAAATVSAPTGSGAAAPTSSSPGSFTVVVPQRSVLSLDDDKHDNAKGQDDGASGGQPTGAATASVRPGERGDDGETPIGSTPKVTLAPTPTPTPTRSRSDQGDDSGGSVHEHDRSSTSPSPTASRSDDCRC